METSLSSFLVDFGKKVDINGIFNNQNGDLSKIGFLNFNINVVKCPICYSNHRFDIQLLGTQRFPNIINNFIDVDVKNINSNMLFYESYLKIGTINGTKYFSLVDQKSIPPIQDSRNLKLKFCGNELKWIDPPSGSKNGLPKKITSYFLDEKNWKLIEHDVICRNCGKLKLIYIYVKRPNLMHTPICNVTHNNGRVHFNQNIMLVDIENVIANKILKDGTIFNGLLEIKKDLFPFFLLCKAFGKCFYSVSFRSVNDFLTKRSLHPISLNDGYIYDTEFLIKSQFDEIGLFYKKFSYWDFYRNQRYRNGYDLLLMCKENSFLDNQQLLFKKLNFQNDPEDNAIFELLKSFDRRQFFENCD